MGIGINFSKTTMLGSTEPVLPQLEKLASAGSTDFAAVEVGTSPEEGQRTRALLKKAAANARKMQ